MEKSGGSFPMEKSGRGDVESSGKLSVEDSVSFTASSPLLHSDNSMHKSGSVRKKGSSWWASVILLVNTCIGAGMLNMAKAFSNAGGLPVGISAQIIMSFLLSVTMTILCYCSDIKQVNTFQDTVYTMCGKKAMLVSAVAAVVYAFGLVVTFMIIVGDQIDIFLTFTYGDTYCHHWYLSREFMMAITITMFVLPLAYPERVDFLKYGSFVGFVAIFYVVFYQMVTYGITVYPQRGEILWAPVVWTDIFAVVPTTCFAYQVHLTIVPIYSCLEKRGMPELGRLMVPSMILITFAFTCAGTFGYMSFGTHVLQDCLLSYRPVTPQLLVGTLLIAGKMYTDAPILSFVGRTACDSLFCYFARVSEENVIRHEKKRRVIIATIWFICALTVAILLPHIGVVISVMGGLAAVFSILIPGCCLLQATLQGFMVSKKKKIIQWWLYMCASGFYIAFGTFILVVVVVRALMIDIAGVKEPIPPNGTCM